MRPAQRPMAANAATRPPATDEARLSEFFEAANSDVDDDTLASLLKGLSVNQPQWSLRRVSPQLSCVWPAFRAEADCQALHCAAASGSANAVASLLRRDAHWSARTRRGVTPILLAAAGGHADVVALLLDAEKAHLNSVLYSVELGKCAFLPGLGFQMHHPNVVTGTHDEHLNGTPLGPDDQPGPTPLYAAARLRTEQDIGSDTAFLARRTD